MPKILDQPEDKYSLNTLNHKMSLESGQVALTVMVQLN